MAIGDIVADRIVEQHAVLRNDADGRAERCLRNLGDVLPVDQYAAYLRIIKAEQQPCDSALACTGRANNSDIRTCWDFET